MPAIKGMELVFDKVASNYEKFRPGYVKELYQTLFDYIPINEDSKVVEIGSGAGEATTPILETGCELVAVEPGNQFSKLLKERFKEYKNFLVITDKFEDIAFEDNSFDLVFSASAFHWIKEKAGYEKAFSMLKRGGAFARFANHPYRSKENPMLSQEIDKIYNQYYNSYYNKKQKTISEYNENQAKGLAMIACQYGFSDIRYKLFHRERVFSAKEYIELLETYSDHVRVFRILCKRFPAR